MGGLKNYKKTSRFCTRGVTVTSLNSDRVVINFQKMQDLPSKTFINLGPFREFAESTFKIYLIMGSKMYRFPLGNACFQLGLA